ncbi:MAG: TonB-dependent receptor [Candidatus Stahlbacteria bacterium]|nr:TonB-dependent receptor [Candidatus Stahlbacteria bacterium]
MVKKVIVFIVPIFICQSMAWAELTSVIKGNVRAVNTRLPLVGTNIVVLDTKLGAATDTFGNFIIPNVPVGTYRLEATMLGYTSIVKTDVVVSTGRATFVEVNLNEAPIVLKGITVKAKYFAKDVSAPTSKHNLSREEIRRSPGSASDVSRMIQNLPGVNFVSDARNDLVVRGGSPAENLNLYDGIEIPNTNHFGTQGATGGPITMVQSEFIRDIDFYTGAFSAKYGNKLSSVLDIHLRNGTRDEFLGTFDLSMSGAGLIVEGPLFRGSYLLSARKSYLELIKEQIGFSALPIYADAQCKVVQKLSDKHSLSILGIGGIDHIEFAPGEEEEHGNGGVEVDQTHYALGTKLTSLWSKDLFSTLIVSRGYDLYDVYVKDTLDTRLYDNESNESENTLRTDVIFKNISLGVYLKQVALGHKIYHKGDERFPDIDMDFSDTPYKAGAYLQPEFKFGNISGAVGVHYHYFDYTEISSFSPRTSLSFVLIPNLSLNAGWGIFYQNPSYVWLTVFPENKELKDMVTRHYEKVYGTLAYTYSETKHKALDGIERYGSYDTPHVINTVLGYRPMPLLELGVKCRYASGRPYTPIDTTASKQSGFEVRNKTQVNALRYPDYFRIDFRFDIHHYFKGWNIVWYLDLQNLLDRHNIYFYYWNEKENKVETSYQWARMIVGGVKIEF